MEQRPQELHVPQELSDSVEYNRVHKALQALFGLTQREWIAVETSVNAEFQRLQHERTRETVLIGLHPTSRIWITNFGLELLARKRLEHNSCDHHSEAGR